MSDSIDAIGSAITPVAAPETAQFAHPSPTTSSYADTTTEVPRADGTVVVIVTDAQGEVVSSTTVHNQTAAASTAVQAAPTHVLSFEA